MARTVLYIAKEDRSRYDRLEDERIGDDATAKHLFLLAAATGYRSGRRQKFEQRVEYTRVEYLQDLDKALLQAIAIQSEEDVEVTLDMDRVYEIAEEYAHVGIRLLADMVESSPLEGVERHFEQRLDETYHELIG